MNARVVKSQKEQFSAENFEKVLIVSIETDKGSYYNIPCFVEDNMIYQANLVGYGNFTEEEDHCPEEGKIMWRTYENYRYEKGECYLKEDKMPVKLGIEDGYKVRISSYLPFNKGKNIPAHEVNAIDKKEDDEIPEIKITDGIESAWNAGNAYKMEKLHMEALRKERELYGGMTFEEYNAL